jgi:hypothetical protein
MIEYTKEDMQKLAEMSNQTSPPAVFLPNMNYDPKKFLNFLNEYHLSKDVHYLFELPLEDVPLLINKGEVSGYLQFRLSVAK